MDSYELIIIGGGPAGLSTAIYAKERNLKLLVLEADKIGGQLVNLYPEKYIYDLPGFIEIKGRELAAKLMAQVSGKEIEVWSRTPVSEVVKSGKNFKVKTFSGELQTKAVVLATGMGHYMARKLNVAGEAEFTGKGVVYQKLPDEKMSGKRVVVVGGGDTAVETAILAAEKGAAVTLVHRSPQFRAQEHTVVQAKRLNISIYLGAVVKSVSGSDRIEQVEIEKGSGGVSFLTADYLIICIGVELSAGFLKTLGVELNGSAVKVDENMKTSIDGIYACGDIVVAPGKYRRLTVVFGTAATCINGVYQYLKNPYWAKKNYVLFDTT